MHLEVEQDAPGTCPQCGMELEPKYVTSAEEEDDLELRSMTRRFWVAAALGVPVLLLAMLPMVGVTLGLSPTVSRWVQLALSSLMARNYPSATNCALPSRPFVRFPDCNWENMGHRSR
mgnify:CR=1 FL=1|tara:strand:- start:950 stop:1303 length:354 start_codon:yes stop_codon:yes gene_type:complete